MHINNTVFYYDAQTYWDLATKSINFQQWPITYRGIIFPMILGICKRGSTIIFGNEYILYRLLYSILAVVFFTLRLPYIMNIEVVGCEAKQTRRWIIGSVSCVITYFAFWKDTIIYPL